MIKKLPYTNYLATDEGNILRVNSRGENVPVRKYLLKGRNVVKIYILDRGKMVTVPVAQAVAVAFGLWQREDPLREKQIRHIDGNRLNDSPNNLWCSEDDQGELTVRRKKGIRSHKIEDGDIIGKTYSSIYEATKDGFHRTNILRCLKDPKRKHKGFHWEEVK